MMNHSTNEYIYKIFFTNRDYIEIDKPLGCILSFQPTEINFTIINYD